MGPLGRRKRNLTLDKLILETLVKKLRLSIQFFHNLQLIRLSTNKPPNQKTRRPKKTFLQRHVGGYEEHEKMVNVANYCRNTNQDYNELPPHTSQNDYHQTSTNNKCWRECGEKETRLHCWWECKVAQPLERTVWKFLRKLKTELPYDPATPLLDTYLEKTVIWRRTCTPPQHYLQ